MKKTRLSFRKSRWQRSDTNEIKPDYNNAFTVLGVLLTELANAAAAVLLTVCAVSVVNTTVSHVRCPYYVHVWLFIFSVISGFINILSIFVSCLSCFVIAAKHFPKSPSPKH